jgi:hypothetical protein
MRKTGSWTLLFALLMVAVLSECSKGSNTTKETISKQEAMDVALKSASVSRPEMSGSQVTPSNVKAEQMTLIEAVKRIDANNDSVAAGYSPDMLVWLVTMDGLWLAEFPRPTAVPAPEPYRHVMIILDAESGLEIENAALP